MRAKSCKSCRLIPASAVMLTQLSFYLIILSSLNTLLVLVVTTYRQETPRQTMDKDYRMLCVQGGFAAFGRAIPMSTYGLHTADIF